MKNIDHSCRRTIILGLLVSCFVGHSRAVTQDPQLLQLSQSIRELTARVSPAVVQIIVTGLGPAALASRQPGLAARQYSGGSGVILDPAGYLVTNAHVIEGARRIQVVLSDRNVEKQPPGNSILKPAGKVVDAELVGVDRETDLAVLKVPETDLLALELGDSEAIEQGQIVLAIGSPLGFENSVSMGIVSAVSRQLEPDAPMIYLQTDAPINPGNSGGPLIDVQGRVIGINTLIVSQSGGNEGLGFAAPSNIVRNVFEQIKQHGRVRRGDVGVVAQTITSPLAEGLNLPRPWGVVLGDVIPGSSAFLARLKVGAVILSIDGKVLENGWQFDVNLYRRAVGETVTLEVARGETRFKTNVLVVEREDPEGRFANLVTPEKNLIPQLGVLMVDINAEIATMLPPLRMLGGVLVAVPSPQLSHIWGGQLLPGDVVFSLNGERFNRLDRLREQLDGMDRGAAVVLQIQRQGLLRYLAFQLE